MLSMPVALRYFILLIVLSSSVVLIGGRDSASGGASGFLSTADCSWGKAAIRCGLKCACQYLRTSSIFILVSPFRSLTAPRVFFGLPSRSRTAWNNFA